MARGCPGSCEGIAHGMAHSWHTGPITSQPKVVCQCRAHRPKQIKHKQNKPATAATILRNLPTTPTSRATGASAKAQHKQNLAMAAMIVCGMYPWHPEVGLHHRPGPNTTQTTHPAMASTVVRCAEFTHDTSTPTSRASPSARPKHDKQHTQQWPQRLCRIYPQPTTTTPTSHASCGALALTIGQTQHKQKVGNSCNNCAEFTHAPTKSRCTIAPNTTQTNKSWQRPQQLCGIYPCTYKVALALHHLPKHKHKQKPATAATIVRNLPTHPQVALRCTIAPNTTQTNASNSHNDCAEFTHAPTVALHGRPKHNTNKKQPSNGCIDYAEFSHSGHQIPASKNVLKTSFSKGELGMPQTQTAISHPFLNGLS